jgi:hypothetical protein
VDRRVFHRNGLRERTVDAAGLQAAIRTDRNLSRSRLVFLFPRPLALSF